MLDMDYCSNIQILTYTSHEETESTTQAETHSPRDDCFDRAGLHTTLHLYRGSLELDECTSGPRTNHLDHSLFLFIHSLGARVPS